MIWRNVWVGVAALVTVGCTTVSLAKPDQVLSENQAIDLLKHSNRWVGRTVTLKVYPYDNGHTGSYVACFESCDARLADRSITLIYTKPDRFRGYRGDQLEIVKAVFGKICPESMPICLDAPIRLFALNEVR